MAQVIRCPKCGGKNYDYETVCSKCGTPLRLAEEIKAEIERMLITTTPTVEGCPIQEYLGVLTANVVLGSNWSTDWNTAMADFTGGRAEGMQTKLQGACDAALNELRVLAHKRGGNAVVGVDVDYQIFSGNMLMVSANGTVVKLSRAQP